MYKFIYVNVNEFKGKTRKIQFTKAAKWLREYTGIGKRASWNYDLDSNGAECCGMEVYVDDDTGQFSAIWGSYPRDVSHIERWKSAEQVYFNCNKILLGDCNG